MSQIEVEVAKDRHPLSQHEVAALPPKIKSWLHPYRPNLKSWHFWGVQTLVIGIAIIHDIIEMGGYLPHLGMLYFIPISLFFVPVVYAALNFGFGGSFATALWIIIITIPNWLLWHHGLERWGVIFQMSILVTVAFFVGQRVDRERAARQRAQAYAAYIVRGQEEERQRIARDLHDDSIQSLVLVCRQLDGVRDPSLNLPPRVNDGLQAARSTVEQVVTGLRDFAKALRPPILDDLGMVASIRRLLMDFTERTQIGGELKVAGKNRRLSPDAEIGVFRIAQQALWNIEHHARATSVTVNIIFNDKEAGLEVVDNGVGFAVPPAPTDFAATGKLGLIGMSERAELLGGRLEIQSTPGKGTRVITYIPL